ncbi:MAG: B12-binding domain-containing radical SAM protein [Planctomycetota bacterium]|jgi:radical SAM superfamily enzyme YgiQ (UPF0313 family)
MVSTKAPMPDPAEIILLYPKTGLDVGGHTVAPPHSLLAVAAPLHRAGRRIKIIDMRRDYRWRQTLKSSIGKETVCIGVSTMTGTQLYFAMLMAEEARRLTDGNVPIVWGGPHPSILPEQTAQSELVDIVVVGEGEITFPLLIEAIEKKQPLETIEGLAFGNGQNLTLTPPRPFIDLDTLLPVPWELIDVEDYINEDNYFLKNSPRTLDIGQTSRGCPHKCGFCCSSSILEKKWRGMSIERALQAIEEPVKRFDLSGVWIRDDEFYVNRKRAFEICERIVAGPNNLSWYATGSRVDDFNKFTDEQIRLIVKSGGKISKFGAESGSDRILELINKGFHVEDIVKANEKCKKHGIVPAYSFIVGFPTETFEEINATIDLAFRLQQTNPAAQLETFPTYTPFPGTPMWPLAIKHGLKPPERIEGWVDWIMDDYDLEGMQIPWFNRTQRKWIGNISYLSICANAVANIGAGIKNPFMHAMFSGALGTARKYYRWKLKTKRYKFAPELALARRLRRRIFYRNEKNFR